jgi:DNA polymerase-3 subunit alpha
MVDDFIDRKHGRAKVIYPHPDLESILKPTYGVILYQEQVMQIAQVLANYSLGAADLLRRAMGKKKPEEMAKQREIFTQGAAGRGIDPLVATSIFDLMEKFAGYGFNKSHSAAYALVAYQTAWLKAHYPAAFMAAVLSSDMDNTDKVVNFIHECEHMGLQLVAPSINQSQYHFTILDEKTIIYGLGAIKGVGEIAIECLVQDRVAHGLYEGLFNVCQRVDLRKVNRRVLEALIKSGALDTWGVERSKLYESIDKAIQIGIKHHQNASSGQTDLLSLLEENQITEDYVSCPSWTTKKHLEGEKQTLGFYLSGHPVTPYQQELIDFIKPISMQTPSSGKKTTICALIKSIRHILTKRGKKLTILNVEDSTGSLDIVVFSEVFEPHQEHISAGQIIVIEGELGQDDYSGGLKMTATSLYRLEEARTRYAKCLKIRLSSEDHTVISALQSVLAAHQGECVVQLDYANVDAKASINLGSKWRVLPSDELMVALEEVLDKHCVDMCY